MPLVFAYLTARLTEPSTYLGLAVAARGVHDALLSSGSPATALGYALGGLLGIVMPEKGSQA